MILKRAKNFFDHLARNGVSETYYYARQRFSERWHEKYYGVETASLPIELAPYGYDDKEFVHYYPVTYAACTKALNSLPLTSADVFLDFGCGHGRVLVLAAAHPIERVIGIDLIDDFVARARRNMERAKHRSQCGSYEIEQANTVTYEIPDDVTIFHFYNPFQGEILDKTLENIGKSLQRTPRDATILFANPEDFERAIKDQPWITRQHEIAFPNTPGIAPVSEIYRIYKAVPPEEAVTSVAINDISRSA